MHMLGRWASDLGFLRTVFALCVMLVSACAPLADGSFHSDWRFWPGVIAPVFVPVLAFTLPLDITMAGVFRASTEDRAEKQRYRRIIWFDTGLLTILILSWTPFIIRLTAPVE